MVLAASGTGSMSMRPPPATIKTTNQRDKGPLHLSMRADQIGVNLIVTATCAVPTSGACCVCT
jgi:hypothetical protein